MQTNTLQRTFKELREIDDVIADIFQKEPELRETKFGYAYKRFSDINYEPFLKRFNEELADIRVNNALEDAVTKEILIDHNNVRGYKYTKEGLINVMKDERALVIKYESMPIEITPFISKLIPEKLNNEQVELLKGLII